MTLVCSGKRHVKELFEEWCQVTTCAGVIDWKMSKTTFSKIFWSMLIALGVALTSWQTVSLAKNFFTDDLYQTALSMISTDGLNLPNVTICNFNRLDRTKIGDVENDVLSYAFIPASHSSYKISYNFSEHEINSLETRWRELKQKLKVEDLKELYQKYGYSCEETFVRCKYELSVEFNCCLAATESMNSGGRCWTIEPEKIPLKNEPNPKQKFPGAYYGLELTINPKLQTYLPNILDNYVVDQGIIVQPAFYHHSYLHYFIPVPPGMHSWIRLDAVVNTVKTYDISLLRQNCRRNLELTILNVPYSKANCALDCWQQIQWRVCHCVGLSSVKPQYQICDTLSMINCLKTFHTLYKKHVSELLECRNGCKNMCEDYWRVEMSQSSTKFIGDHNIEAVSKLWSDEQLSLNNSSERNETLKNLICLTIFYSSLDYLQVETGETNPLFVSIANVGGQLSLWLGVSIVTILQIIYYLIRCCFGKRAGENCGKRGKNFEINSFDTTITELNYSS